MTNKKIEVTLHKLGVKPQVVNVKSLEEASYVISNFVNKTRMGSSQMGKFFGNVKVNGVKKYKVSYNGRVWDLNGEEVMKL